MVCLQKTFKPAEATLGDSKWKSNVVDLKLEALQLNELQRNNAAQKNKCLHKNQYLQALQAFL